MIEQNININIKNYNNSRKKRSFSIIGAAIGWGAQITETEFGPEYVFQSNVPQHLITLSNTLFWEDIIYPTKRLREGIIPLGPERVSIIADHATRLAQKVTETIKKNRLPIVVGGDHSIAIGTWTGITHALKTRGKFGLLWMDAHMDAHTPETSPSQAYHGMPVATLLGYGHHLLTEILSKESKINPAHLIIYGAQSFEPEEKTLLEKLGVRIYLREEIFDRGIDVTLTEALDYLEQHTQGFGVSIDLDVFDSAEVPGVGSPVDGGLPVQETLNQLRQLQQRPSWQGLEITEYNPQRDQQNKTLAVIQGILETIMNENQENMKAENMNDLSSSWTKFGHEEFFGASRFYSI